MRRISVRNIRPLSEARAVVSDTRAWTNIPGSNLEMERDLCVTVPQLKEV